MVEVNGKEFSLRELSEIYDISINTLKKRHAKNLRGEDLIRKPQPKGHILLEGQPHEITEEQLKSMKHKQISKTLLVDRLSHGWSMEQATMLSKRYVQKNSQICYQAYDENCFYYIPIKELEKYDIKDRNISHSMKYGKSIYECVPAECVVYEEEKDSEEREKEILEKHRREEQRRKKRIENMRLEKKVKNHPWLYNGTPQKHKRSKWVNYLMANDIFPKVVKKDE